jgi:hypothetical protein
MFFWATPTRVEQPGFGVIPDLSCWAAALSSWQLGMGRKMESITALEGRFQKHKPSPMIYRADYNRWTLDAGKFYLVAADQNVKMAWRRLKGADLIKWDLEMLLNLCGYIYMVCKPLDSKEPISHARVMYGASGEWKVGYFVDPSPKYPGPISWEYSRMRQFDFLVAVDKGTVPFWQRSEWQNAS